MLGFSDTATQADIELLTQATHLKSIIDLRTDTELKRVPSANPSTDPVATLSDATVYHIPFLNDKFRREVMLGRLPWYRFLQLMVYHILGFKTAVVKLIVKLVLVPLGLRGLALKWLHYFSGEINSVFKILSHEERYPSLIHCTQGKDRTGLVILLILLSILGDDDTEVRAMDYDYMLSNDGLKGVRAEMIAEMEPVGITEASGFADAEEGWVRAVVEYIEDQWGGIDKYLASIGVTGDDIKSVRQNLLVSPW
ncbi:hypothetical protein ABW19_dt0201615 [Dactylella cylindrospora]|nr:hypothetical protein ABW19_dt0201615 [Dactylella cylindrospora]